MKVVFDSTTGRIHRAYADDNFSCSLGPNEDTYIFDNFVDPSDKKVDLSSAPSYVMINQDTVKITATNGSIVGEQVTLAGVANIQVNEAISFVVQKIDGETQAEKTAAQDAETMNFVVGDLDFTSLASINIENGVLSSGQITFTLTAPSIPGNEELQIYGDGLKAVSVTLNYVSI